MGAGGADGVAPSQSLKAQEPGFLMSQTRRRDSKLALLLLWALSGLNDAYTHGRVRVIFTPSRKLLLEYPEIMFYQLYGHPSSSQVNT